MEEMGGWRRWEDGGDGRMEEMGGWRRWEDGGDGRMEEDVGGKIGMEEGGGEYIYRGRLQRRVEVVK